MRVESLLRLESNLEFREKEGASEFRVGLGPRVLVEVVFPLFRTDPCLTNEARGTREDGG